MTFEEWYTDNEYTTYDKTEYDCMKLAWRAAVDAASAAIFPLDDADAAYNAVNALKTPLNAPTSPEQGQAKGQVATQGYSGPSSTACDDQLRGG